MFLYGSAPYGGVLAGFALRTPGSTEPSRGQDGGDPSVGSAPQPRPHHDREPPGGAPIQAGCQKPCASGTSPSKTAALEQLRQARRREGPQRTGSDGAPGAAGGRLLDHDPPPPGGGAVGSGCYGAPRPSGRPGRPRSPGSSPPCRKRGAGLGTVASTRIPPSVPMAPAEGLTRSRSRPLPRQRENPTLRPSRLPARSHRRRHGSLPRMPPGRSRATSPPRPFGSRPSAGSAWFPRLPSPCLDGDAGTWPVRRGRRGRPSGSAETRRERSASSLQPWGGPGLRGTSASAAEQRPRDGSQGQPDLAHSPAPGLHPPPRSTTDDALSPSSASMARTEVSQAAPGPAAGRGS